MAHLPPDHGSAKAEAGLMVRIVAKKSVILRTVRCLRRLLLDLDSCVLPREMIRPMATSALVFAAEVIKTPQAYVACFGQPQERRK
jgi:hypothetical protein